MKIETHDDLEVYRIAFSAAMKIFNISKSFPKEEIYSLTDQIRRSSRSVCANIAEAFRKRKYPRDFVSKLGQSESEAAETQSWLDFSIQCKYISKEEHDFLYSEYNRIIGKLVRMQVDYNHWCFPQSLSPHDP